VIEAARMSMPGSGGRIWILAFGGSQGARIMSDVVPAAIGLLPPQLRTRIGIVHQAREEDLTRVREAYAEAEVVAEVAPFFKDLPSRMAAAHFVIARGGASTVAELAVIGRPSILVPLPGALDQDQAANAKALAAGGGALVIMQPDFTAVRLAEELTRRLDDSAGLRAMADAAKSVGAADAAERLADVVMALVARI
jgi:UDP-N-acetylglucosamine--N-acetylmuramyl-(pentapeptide) pyrophosphoryl-undecaprenol N-acetylglucosamine transferase